jgi:hypothetical protein
MKKEVIMVTINEEATHTEHTEVFKAKRLDLRTLRGWCIRHFGKPDGMVWRDTGEGLELGWSFVKDGMATTVTLTGNVRPLLGYRAVHK